MRNFIASRQDRYNEIPENLGSERCQDKIEAILNDPNGYKVTDEYNHDDVRSLLRKYFGIKCVYCEASPIATSTFRIDHYRPKKNIKEDIMHTGYYWLAYEWTNLIQACQFCNGSKSNHFPLKVNSFRVLENTPHAIEEAYRNPTINPLSLEQRLLLNPELDEVENHFSFNSDGTISSKTDEGNESIKRYGLLRDDLIISRKKIRDEYLEDIKQALISYETIILNNPLTAKATLFSLIEEKLRKFLKAFKKRDPFSLFFYYMFERFDDFFIAEFAQQNEYQILLRECYNNYKDKK